jgi:hypothetical protein
LLKAGVRIFEYNRTMMHAPGGAVFESIQALYRRNPNQKSTVGGE